LAAEGDSGDSPAPPLPNIPPMPDLPPLNITGIFAVEADKEISLLYTIWENTYVESVGINSWKCLRCSKLFKPKHAIRAAAHMAKEKNLGIAICPAVVSKEHAQQYTNLFHCTVNKAIKHKRGQEAVLNAAEARQDAAVLSLCEKKFKKPLVQSFLFSTVSEAGFG
jgi:hypothetical protein